MLQPWLLIRSGTAVSIITHLAVLTVGLGYAGVRPFETVPVEAIAVDLVSPAEVTEAAKETLPEKPSLDIPDLSAKDQPAAAPAPAPPPPPQQPVQQQTPAAPAANPTSTAARQVAARPQSTPAPQPAPPPPPAIASWRPPEPDLSVRYQVNLGLPTPGPGNDFDAPAISKAAFAMMMAA